MGRECKRVALNFKWPLKQIWTGYINPYYSQRIDCPDCEHGYSAEYKRLHDLWYGYAPFKPEDRDSTPFLITDEHVQAFARRQCERAPEFYGSGEYAIDREARRICGIWNESWSHHLNQADVDALVAANRLHDFTHTFVPGKGWQPKDPPYHPTAREVNIWGCGGMGHDGINCWAVIGAECERNGWPTQCARCEGSGEFWPLPEMKRLSDEWKSTEPPAGDGWQMWETTSEGTPMSPVFATPEALADWLASTGASIFGEDTATREEWLRVITGGGSIGLVGDADGLRPHVPAASTKETTN